jgi:ribosomal protein L30E
MKSGKFTLGYKSCLKQLRGGKCSPNHPIVVLICSKTSHHLWQLSTVEKIRTRVLCYARQGIRIPSFN